MNVRVRDVSRKKIYHVMNATIILPEFGNGPSTEVSFTSYEGDRYHVHHMGMWKSTLKLRNDRNANWRELEHQRYENRFLKQMEWYEEKQRSARKSTRCLRFFGKLVCIIRCGHHYFFHIPEALHNTFETMSLQNVEEKVAHMEENLELERQHDIIQDMKNYNSSTLVRSHRQSENSTDTLALIPLHELKTRSGPQRNKSLQFKFTSKMNDVNGIRHSFYTDWRVPLNETKQFAAQNGFKEIPTDSDDYYTSLTVFWRQRELNVLCDKVGRIKEIKHRKVRWLSATFNKIEEDRGHDVRVYLESQTPLDDDETNLKTVIEYLDQRSIFTEAFSKQLQDNRMDQLPSKPLIPDIYHFNWRYRSMRIVATVMKFVNAENDECVLSEIHDGIFHAHSHGFEWFPKHLEFEFRLSTDKASPADLCKKSYDLGLKVFDHAKLNCAQ
ncbi:hypothetical protein HA402_005013 [Bradysia odoriphaga]|nr:hypothetical protein HA402_005013 [Bradysia odoriphaga]